MTASENSQELRAEWSVQESQWPESRSVVDRRVLWLSALSIGLGATTTAVAQLFLWLIAAVTQLAFYGRWSVAEVSPADHALGVFVIFVPMIGAFFVGLLARYGSPAIRGHGIPEAMEKILTDESRIPPRMIVLKPLSAAISIGTGGPFGAEGPIIATGSALGSAIGQLLKVTASERRTLLAAGAAGGTAAIFGSPVAAVLLAVELLLFEFRPRSMIPVALASVTAAGLRLAIWGPMPAFSMPLIQPPGVEAMTFYVLLGALMGVVAVAVTRLVYGIEDAFEQLPIHWMWWPLLGAVAVGVVGWIEPRTLGVGYENISDLLSQRLTVSAAAVLCGLKFLSWSISLGSGTSGGTLAPLFTIGSGLGILVGAAGNWFVPEAGIDLRIAALVGMASLFAGASRALLASAVFAFETTLQPLGLLPLLGGCAAAYLLASLLMKNSIMTEKIARRGIRTPVEYVADPLDQIVVTAVASAPVKSLRTGQTLAEVRAWLAAEPEAEHQGFPVLDDRGFLAGVVTRRDLGRIDRPLTTTVADVMSQPVRFVYDDCTVRQAADHMVNHNIGRLPVVSRTPHGGLVGIVTRSDVLLAYRQQVRRSTAHASTGVNTSPAMSVNR